MEVASEKRADETERVPFTTIDDFELGKPIGTGRFGQVWLVRHRETQSILSLKMIPMEHIKNNTDVKNLRREIEIHLALDHPNILKMYGYFYDSMRIYAIQEYASKGDVWKALHEKGRFDEHTTALYISQICDALHYMHSLNIIHRDIKPENILIGADDQLKVADFGWSVFNRDKRRTTFCGTAEYLPPEVCREDVYDRQADIWCLGILCFEFSTGGTPFSAKGGLRATKQKIISNEIEIPEYLSPECADFILRCCKKEPSGRISLAEAKEHPFLVGHLKK